MEFEVLAQIIGAGIIVVVLLGMMIGIYALVYYLVAAGVCYLTGEVLPPWMFWAAFVLAVFSVYAKLKDS